MENTSNMQIDASHRGVVEQIKDAAAGIENAHKQLMAIPSDSSSLPLIDANESAKLQIVQQTSMVPVILSQQVRMLESLEQKFGQAFTSTCGDEIQDLLNVAKQIQRTMEGAAANATVDASQELFSAIPRLNLLQQRISGKMMKIKVL
ncbi:MAG TPA: hypothetical protein EYM95_20475 [Candidatus Obscuribacterales bacterium]|jgi:hypothetical protein|nr:hypothetical protein [Candidatus Obscuribacterales bacterium]